MDFSEAVQWWEEWQLRVLVLTSLFLQYFLFIASSLRKRSTPAWFKFLTWITYLASDATAIYALATLFNRHKKEWVSSAHHSNASLEVLWAPILLLHLGGQDGITAYNIEDNELWRRHVLTVVSQFNLIGYMGRNKKLHKRLWSFLLMGKDVTTFNKPCGFSSDITEVVHDHVTYGWKECIKDVKTFRDFNDSRGQCTLKRELLDEEAHQPAAAEEALEPRCPPMQQTDLFPSLYGSLQRPFDESVLQWHLATDFCFHTMGMGKSSPHEGHDAAARCREMSNYMAYLLFENPEMLVAGARRSVFTDAYNNLEEMFPSLDHGGTESDELALKIIEKMGSKQDNLVHDAWVLAQELMDIGNKGVEGKKKMWSVIQGVWVEMLCFSANRCRGYLHAKSLGKGGEYLSYVWMLLLYMGMETMAERLQRTEMHVQGDTGIVVTRPASASAPPAGDENA